MNHLQRFYTFSVGQMASGAVMDKDSLAYWQVRILFAIIFSGALMSLLLFIPLVGLVLKKQVWGLLFFDAAAWLAATSLLVSPWPSYRVRATVVLLLIYAAGLMIILFVGPLSGGPAWLFCFAVLVGILLGSRAAVAALVLNTGTLSIIGWMMASGRWGREFPAFDSVEAMIVAGGSFVLLNTVAAISVTILVNRIGSAHNKEKELTCILENERLQLIETKGDLERKFEEHKLAEEALRLSEENYRLHFEHATDVIYSVDSDLNVISVSPSVDRVLGYRPEELVGKPIQELALLPPDYLEKAFRDFSQVFAGSTINSSIYEFIAKDGSRRIGEVSGAPVYKKDAIVATISVARDITDRKEAEKEKHELMERLQKAQKMEAIGTLAGGVAHDFNNILYIILGNTELAMNEVAESSPARHNLEETKLACLRAKDLIQQLLSFSRRTEKEKKPVNLVSLIDESLKLLRSSLPASISILKEIQTDEATTIADPTQIHQIMINLCTNAAHAMLENDGSLRISLSTATLDKVSACPVPELAPGNYIKLSVSDTGHGISPEHREKIFDPYFTTKEVGEGSGMGLSVVHGIVKNLGGAITVVSKPGEGTTFDVFFPAVDTPSLDADPKPAAPLPRGNEHILLVDDEAPIIRMASRMLESFGYRVTAHTSSMKALDAFQADPDQYDLVITDMTMPGMSGDRLARRIKETRPAVPVILCTGFNARMNEHQARASGVHAFIMKPVVKHELAHTVRRTLDETKKKRRILVIDDESQIRAMLRQLLDSQGYEVLTAINGKEGVLKYRNHPFDLVITDIIMPEKEGIEMIMELKQEFPEIKIIAMSGGGRAAPEGYLTIAKKVGAIQTFNKPVDQAHLLRTIEDVLTPC